MMTNCKGKDQVIGALQQMDALSERIANVEAAICRLQGQERDLLQAISQRQQIIQDQALYIRELETALDQARLAVKR